MCLYGGSSGSRLFFGLVLPGNRCALPGLAARAGRNTCRVPQTSTPRHPHASPPWWQRWPLPAVLAWVGCWCLYLALRPHLGLAAAVAAWLLALGLARRQATWPRRLWVAAGFPLSAALLAAQAGSAWPVWPAWVWLLPPALLLTIYPLRAWRDAPLFPTPPGALHGLARQLPLQAGATVLDAGCGLGHGLTALHTAWPQARICGVEWSLPLALLARWRCRFAQVQHGDMWAAGAWAGADLVYLFQRPESMARAWDKACAELPGGWLVSLEFTVPGRRPDLRHALPGAREVLAWRVPGTPARSIRAAQRR